MSYGQKLKDWRKARGLTQTELGLKLGFSNKFVSQHERGAGQPSRRFLEKSADQMGISYEELVAEDPPQTLNKREPGESKSVDIQSVEIQQYQIALELVLARFSDAQREELTQDMLKSGGIDPRLNLAIRQLVVAAIMKIGSVEKKQSIPKN